MPAHPRPRRINVSSVAVCIVCAACGLASAEPQPPAVLTRIGFGSCIRQNKPQPIWDAVIAARPQLFLLIGDNIYGDTEDMAVLKAKYDLLAANPGFAALRREFLHEGRELQRRRRQRQRQGETRGGEPRRTGPRAAARDAGTGRRSETHFTVSVMVSVSV